MADDPGTPPPPPDSGASMLGLPTDDIAGITVEKLINNETALTMMLHYYKILVAENNRLKNDNNTLKTYVDAYETKRSDSILSSLLILIAGIFSSFGTNLLTAQFEQTKTLTNTGGRLLLSASIILSLFGLYLTVIKKS